MTTLQDTLKGITNPPNRDALRDFFVSDRPVYFLPHDGTARQEFHLARINQKGEIIVYLKESYT